MSFEKLEFGYNSGYTKAIQDVQRLFILADWRMHRKVMNQKKLNEFFECVLQNRQVLRDNPNAFIRLMWVDKERKKSKFELYIGE